MPTTHNPVGLFPFKQKYIPNEDNDSLQAKKQVKT